MCFLSSTLQQGDWCHYHIPHAKAQVWCQISPPFYFSFFASISIQRMLSTITWCHPQQDPTKFGSIMPSPFLIPPIPLLSRPLSMATCNGCMKLLLWFNMYNPILQLQDLNWKILRQYSSGQQAQVATKSHQTLLFHCQLSAHECLTATWNPFLLSPFPIISIHQSWIC